MHGWDVVCEGERGIKDELTSEMAPTSHPPNYFQAILKPFLYVLIVPCAVTATIQSIPLIEDKLFLVFLPKQTVTSRELFFYFLAEFLTHCQHLINLWFSE